MSIEYLAILGLFLEKANAIGEIDNKVVGRATTISPVDYNST